MLQYGGLFVFLARNLSLKASRLARFVEATKIAHWLGLEMVGYTANDPIALEYMTNTGRWTDSGKMLGYWMPLAQIDATISANQVRLQTLRIPDLSYSPGSPRQYDAITPPSPIGPAIDRVLSESAKLNLDISKLSGIRSRVLAYLHEFATNVYHEKAFSGLAESIFDRYRHAVDARIAEVAGPVLEKIPSVSDRLAEGDPEAVSQALTTCRRLLEALADAVYPARASIEVNGNVVDLGKDKHKNRITTYIGERVKSESRKRKLRQTLTNVWDRVSGGVHGEVSLDEARSLFLETYLFLGNVVTLPPQSEDGVENEQGAREKDDSERRGKEGPERAQPS